MKKKLALLFLAAISCACFAVGLSACSDGGPDDGTTDGGTSGGSTCETHNYDVDFDWTKATDGYTATATQYCTVCNTVFQTVNATVELTSQTVATCTENGEILYTATAVIDGETYTDTKTVVDPATGHTYSDEWTYDEDYHWHVAICEHTDETSEKEAHTFVKNGSSYVCSACGQTRSDFITSSSDTAEVGANYIILGATTYTDEGTESEGSYITNVTFSVTEGGVYTFSISTDCQALIYIEDEYNNSAKIGDAGYESSNIYSTTFELAAGETITFSRICPANEVEFDSEYIFCLNIEYEEKEVAQVGTVNKPYAFDNPNYFDGSYNGSDSVNATIAAGESYYFTITRESEVLTSVAFSNSNTSSFELYIDGTKIDYATYYFSTGTTTVTFQLKNVSAGELKNTITVDVYSPSLSTSSNELEISSSMLDSTKSITYYVTLSASTSYTVTLGSGTDSNVAVYYLGYTSNPANTLILGSGESATSYTLTNSRTRDQSYNLAFTYTGTTIPDSFKVNITITKIEKTEDDESNVTYTPISLDNTVSLDFSAASTYYYSYTSSSSSSTYTLILDNEKTTFYGVMLYSIVVKVNGSTISGTQETDGVYYVLPSGSTEYKISITFTNSTTTVTATLKSGGESTEITATALSLGANTVSEGNYYTFTATDAGSYTITVSNTSGYAQIYDSTNTTNLLDEGGTGDTTYSVSLSANETFTFYVTNGGDGDFTITIAKS